MNKSEMDALVTTLWPEITLTPLQKKIIEKCLSSEPMQDMIDLVLEVTDEQKGA